MKAKVKRAIKYIFITVYVIICISFFAFQVRDHKLGKEQESKPDRLPKIVSQITETKSLDILFPSSDYFYNIVSHTDVSSITIDVTPKNHLFYSATIELSPECELIGLDLSNTFYFVISCIMEFLIEFMILFLIVTFVFD